MDYCKRNLIIIFAYFKIVFITMEMKKMCCVLKYVGIIIIDIPCIHNKLIYALVIYHKELGFKYYGNKTLGRALDPCANGTWLSKLTE